MFLIQIDFLRVKEMIGKIKFGERTDIVAQLIEKCDEYTDIIIFGAGIGGKQILDILEENGYQHKVMAICDNAERKKVQLIMDIEGSERNTLLGNRKRCYMHYLNVRKGTEEYE